MSHFEASFYSDSEEDDQALEELSQSDPALKARLKRLLLQLRSELSQHEHEQHYEEESESESEEEEEQDEQPKNKAMSAVTRLSSEQKIAHTLTQFSAVFSNVFQAILVLMDETAAANMLSPGEEEKVTKRSKEFQIRLNRMNFELKQKVHVTRAATVKLRMTPESTLLATAADSKLYGALRCGLVLLRSYLAHLPLSGGRICPDALDAATDVLLNVADLTRQLGYEAEEMAADTKRLKAASEKFHAGRRKKNTAEEKQKSPKKQKAAGSVASAPINLIDNLAREKFGVRFPVVASPKKTNPTRHRQQQQKVIIPRANAVLKDRAARSASRRGIEKASSELNRSRMNVTPKPILTSSNECLSMKSVKEEEGFLNLEDDELEHILRFRRRQHQPGDKKSRNSMRPESVSDSVELICQLSQEIVGDIVKGVALEMMNEDVIARLLHCELKEQK